MQLRGGEALGLGEPCRGDVLAVGELRGREVLALGQPRRREQPALLEPRAVRSANARAESRFAAARLVGGSDASWNIANLRRRAAVVQGVEPPASHAISGRSPPSRGGALKFGAMDQLAAYGSSEDEPTSLLTHQQASRPAPLPPPPPREPRRAADTALVRQFPHVDGNFAAHVFLTVVPAPVFQKAIDRAVAALKRGPEYAPADASQVHRLAEYHVSLSRTFVLRRPQIAPFGEALQKALRGCRVVRADCDTLHQLPNDTSTRHFAAVGLRRGTAGHGAACRLVDAVDAVLAATTRRPAPSAPPLFRRVVARRAARRALRRRRRHRRPRRLRGALRRRLVQDRR